MNVLITGATGLIGQKIVELCQQRGDSIHFLTHRKSKLDFYTAAEGYLWNPEEGKIDLRCFFGVHKIIHLAGANIGKRWTKAYKREIISSRIKSTALLLKSLKENENEVDQLVSASTIGIYPSSLERSYEESSSNYANDFLGTVTRQWEEISEQFTTLGIRIAQIRTGLVLGRGGGFLSKIIPPIKFGFGGALGSGKQWQSWIHVDDIARLYLFLLEEDLEGVFNGVAPHPVRQIELIKAIARQIHRPIWLPPVPVFVLRFLLGGRSTLVLSSQRVSSDKIEHCGFTFRYPRLKPALEELI